ncbi:hypothetical protein [Serratia marcescens]|uniref:hypothetical protein n=1 Tax=Serratia marcescens TaxID=615 RepID=UPI00124A8543|nr:hypothetical protein [Serratia marcescens]KAB1578730.1 hypothetical protein F7687_22610 [Serratia marcescens]
MELNTEGLTRKQLINDFHIISLCLRNHYGPDDLERIAYLLAQINSAADAATSRSKASHDF